MSTDDNEDLPVTEDGFEELIPLPDLNKDPHALDDVEVSAEAIAAYPQDEISEEQLELYLKVWRTAFVSGYVSAGVNSLARAGVDEHARYHIALILDRQARHTIDNVMRDPITRNMVVVEAIKCAVTGKPYDGPMPSASELSVQCSDPDHHHGGDGS